MNSLQKTSKDALTACYTVEKVTNVPPHILSGRVRLVACLVLLFTIGLVHAQTVRRVAATPPEGSDNSGDSWANATSLSNALFESVSGDGVWLQAGTYTPSASSNARDAVFSVPAGIALYGGFAGVETSLAERNRSTTNTTLISGERGNPDSNTDNIRRLITISAGEEVILDGLTLADVYGSNNGAGVYARNAVLRIHNCLFRNNRGYDGGAVYGSFSSTLTITGSTFTGNSASSGGAVYGGEGTLTITGNTFIGNSARSFAGAVAGFGSGTLANNIFFGNTATSGRSQVVGGYNNTLRLTHNLIEGGSAGLSGISGANGGTIITASSLADIFLGTTPGSPGYLRLKADSPAIDAGTNDWIDGDADVYEAGDETDVTDRAGNARLVGTQVDLGAYEYDAMLPLFDVTTTPAVTTGLPASGGTVTTAIGLSGAATGWSATTNDPFITLSPASGTADGTLAIRYTSNNSGSARTGNVTIASTGGTGKAFTHTLTLTQTTILRVAATLPTGSDESGSSWANAMSLHTALLAFTHGDTIWLQAGSYTPVYQADGSSPSNARDAVFRVPAGAVLYGGFAGIETSLAERNLSTANTTLISGEIGDLNDNTDNVQQLITVGAGAAEVTTLILSQKVCLV